METPAECICYIEVHVDETLCKLAGVSSEVMCSTYMRASSLYAWICVYYRQLIMLIGKIMEVMTYLCTSMYLLG